MFFSYVPRRPIAPGSSPPWPGSIAIVIRRRPVADPRRGPGGGSALGSRSGLLRLGSRPLLEKRHQRIERYQRIQVENDAMPEFGDGLQREELRARLGLEVEYDAQDVGRPRSEADRGDVRVGGVHAGRQLHEVESQLGTLQLEHHAIRVLQRDDFVRDRRRCLDNDARVFLRRPQPRGGDLRCRSPRRPGNDELRGGDEQPPAHLPAFERDRGCARTPHRMDAIALRHRSPFSVCAASAR